MYACLSDNRKTGQSTHRVKTVTDRTPRLDRGCEAA